MRHECVIGFNFDFFQFAYTVRVDTKAPGA